MLFVGINLKRWNARGTKLNADSVARRRVLTAANYLQQRIRRNISIPARGGPDGRDVTTGRFTKGKLTHSKPGEYPHRVTGHLHKTIFRRPLNTSAGPAQDVGTKTFYGIIHEVTKRPFITRTFYEQGRTIRRILAGGAAPRP